MVNFFLNLMRGGRKGINFFSRTFLDTMISLSMATNIMQCTVNEDELPKMRVDIMSDGLIEELSHSKNYDQDLSICPITERKIKVYKNATPRCIITADALYMLKEQLIMAISLNVQVGQNPKQVLNNVWRTRTKICTLLFWLLKNHETYALEILNNLGRHCEHVNASDIGMNKKMTRWNDIICVETGWTVKAYLEKIEGSLLRHSK